MKSKPVFSIESYGIYDAWDSENKALPSIRQFTSFVCAEIDIEFGLIISAQKAKGEILTWHIHHPDICDTKGRKMAPFEGEVYVRTNDWKFYLGDTIWPPIEDKCGDWHMFIKHNNQIIAEKTFEVTQEDLEDAKERAFWKKRGY